MQVNALDHVNIITDRLDATAEFYAALLNNKILVFVPDDLREQIEQLRRRGRTEFLAVGALDGWWLPESGPKLTQQSFPHPLRRFVAWSLLE